MPRSLSIALVYSLAIHLALFWIADSLLRARTEPSNISTPLVVSIEPTQTTGDVADSRLAVPATRAAAPQPAGVSRPSRPADKPSRIESAALVPAVTETGPPDLESAAETSTAEEQADSEEAAVIDVVATTSPARPVAVARLPEAEPPVPARATIPRKEKEMLDRRLAKWSYTLHEMPESTSELTWKHKGQDYVARFTELPVGDDMAIERATVEISTEQDGKRLSSEVQFKRLAFSNYAQFINRWDPDVEIHDDEMDGRFHSNTMINVAHDRDAQPVFHGNVTTTSRRVNLTRRLSATAREQIFAGGLQTGVRRIGLPKRYLPFPDEGELAEDQVHRFTDDTRITFHADGTFVWQAIDAEMPEETRVLSESTTYLIADKKAELHVKGTVNGKVLLYSPERIVIEDDLVYAQHPEESDDSDDYVGLVSEKYVEIAPPEITGTGDLLVHGAIYAKRRFAVRRYRSNDNALLYLYGSLSAGSISASQPRYATRIQFDPRLEHLRPPGFPVTDRYEVESWDAAWTVEPLK